MPSESDSSRVPWTRRLFVGHSLLAWLGLVIGPAAYSLVRRYDSLSVEQGAGTKDLGAASEFSLGQAKEVALGGKKVLVVRLENGDWAAVSAVCTHMGCSVRFERDGHENVVACNCHKSRFDLDGTNLSGPAPYPLARYEIAVRAEKVMLSGPRLSKDESH